MYLVLLYMQIIKHYFLHLLVYYVMVKMISFMQERDQKVTGVYLKILAILSIQFIKRGHCLLRLMQRQLIMPVIVLIVKEAWTFIVLYYQKIFVLIKPFG